MIYVIIKTQKTILTVFLKIKWWLQCLIYFFKFYGLHYSNNVILIINQSFSVGRKIIRKIQTLSLSPSLSGVFKTKTKTTTRVAEDCQLCTSLLTRPLTLKFPLPMKDALLKPSKHKKMTKLSPCHLSLNLLDLIMSVIFSNFITLLFLHCTCISFIFH